MKKVIISFALLISICLFSSCGKNNDKVLEKSNDTNMINVYINDQIYDMTLESNDAALELLNMLPLNLTMNELNGNEKYAYLNKSLPSNSKMVKHINAGDVMLYGDNCLVIFYKSFDTTYSYTKIGHIDKIPDLGTDDIIVKIK